MTSGDYALAAFLFAIGIVSIVYAVVLEWLDARGRRRARRP